MFLSLWFDSCNSSAEWYIGKFIKEIDKLYMKIKPPSEFSRLPRSMADHRNFFKGMFHFIYMRYIPAGKTPFVLRVVD